MHYSDGPMRFLNDDRSRVVLWVSCRVLTRTIAEIVANYRYEVETLFSHAERHTALTCRYDSSVYSHSHHAELLVLPIHGLVYTESLQFIATPTECYSSIALGAFRLIVCDCRSLGLWYLPNESQNGLAWWMILTCGYNVWVQRVKGQGLKVCS